MNDEEHDRQQRALSLLADTLVPVTPPAELRQQLLAAMRGPQRFAPFTAEVEHAFGLSRSAVDEAFARIGDPAAWHTAFAPGWEVLTTPALERARAVIARLPPSAAIPAHVHGGRELTYVLDGVLIEDGARHHSAGQLLAMEPGSEHAISVGAEHSCLVVFALHAV